MLEVLNQQEGGQGRQGRAGGVQRHHQVGRHRGDEAPARHRHGAGRRLPGPPRAGLSGRLHPLAGAVAQAAGRALGRPRAVGGAAPGRRPRDRDRGASRPRNTGPSRPTSPPAATRSWPAWSSTRASGSPSSTSPTRPPAHGRQGRGRGRPASRSPRSRRSPARRTPAAALHHLDPAAGSLAQARLLRPAHHAGRPEALRRRRHRRRDRRPDHLHADRRRADRARGAGRGARGDRRPSTARTTCPRAPRYLQDQGQERPGGARGDPADQPGAQPRLAAPGARPRPALRADLEADDRLQMEAARIERTTIDLESADGQTGLRATGQVVLFDGYLARLRGRPRRRPASDEDDSRPPAAGRRGRRRPRCSPPAPTSTSPSRRRATPKPPGQEDGGARHRPALDLRLDPHRAARPRLCADGEEPLRPRGQGPAGHRLPRAVLPPLRRVRLHRRRWRRSSTWSRPASSTGRRCCATSGRTSTPPSARSASCASARCSRR